MQKCSMTKKIESIKKNRVCESSGWDGWASVYGLKDTLDLIYNLTYELERCVRGVYTGAKTWKDLSDYIKELAQDLSDAADEMAGKPEVADDDED